MIQLSDRWEFYKDRFSEWQWRKFESNKVVAVSADGFYSRQACVNNARQRGYDPQLSPLPRKQREATP
ncbi:MAG: DUF1508 domain-containing protein [Ignavibacteriae bacterium]|nr:DUF1508 domain-containing protein [Ignavibacteria bacterium]MBI3365826.1 DUF1508 domain-containing protein [Ignavibacteriota bacterium]